MLDLIRIDYKRHGMALALIAWHGTRGRLLFTAIAAYMVRQFRLRAGMRHPPSRTGR